MRHRKARTTLGRSTAHRQATMGNMLCALIEHGRIRTTEAKARAVRRLAERTVTRATRLGDSLLKDWTKLEVAERAKLVHAIRQVRRTVKHRDMALRVFDEWAPRYIGRPGGYTRVFKLNNRRGDNAPMALVEFVPAEMPNREGSEGGSDAKRSRRRLFGGKQAADQAGE